MEPLSMIRSSGKIVWMTRPIAKDAFLQALNDTIINVMVEDVVSKLSMSDAVDVIIQSAENLGKLVYDKYIQKRAETKTPFDWAKHIADKLLAPMGAYTKFSECTDDMLVAEAFQCPTVAHAINDPKIIYAFAYGFASGLWTRAFPKGAVTIDKA